MIPQNKHQPGPPGRIAIWGHPWHGLVEAGTLTLPNSITMDYAAPSGAGEADVLAFQPPGTPAVVRNPTQAAADADAGRQWLDYALISGRYTRRLYGQAIGGNGSWLYAAPTGSRWLITLADVPGTHDLTAPWDATLTCTRFGDVPGTPEEHTLTATLSDWQQDLPGHPDGDYALDFYGDNSSAEVGLEDVNLAGSAAILSVGIDLSTPDWGGFNPVRNPLRRLPIGFIEITLTGTPGVDAAAALAVLFSRAETLGTATDSETDATQTQWLRVTTDGLGNPESAAWESTIFTGYAAISTSGTYTQAGEWAGRILAAVYDADGTVQTITLRTAYTSTSIAPAFADDLSFSRDTSVTSTASITLSGPAGSATIALQMDLAGNQSGTVSGTASQSNTQTVTTTVGPETNTKTEASTGSPVPLSLFVLSNETFTLGRGGADGAHLPRSPVATFGTGGGGHDEFYVGVTRYSATALELILGVYVQTPADPSGQFGRWHHFGALSPRGAQTDIITTTDQRQFGSAHPVTGEIARARDVPVCWV